MANKAQSKVIRMQILLSMMRKTFFAGKLSVKDKPAGEMNVSFSEVSIAIYSDKLLRSTN